MRMIPGDPGQLAPVRAQGWRSKEIVAIRQDRNFAGLKVYRAQFVLCFLVFCRMIFHHVNYPVSIGVNHTISKSQAGLVC